MLNKEFDIEAMKGKVKVNLAKGLKINDIKILLREELIENRKSALTLEQRATELQDQMEFMDKHYATTNL